MQPPFILTHCGKLGDFVYTWPIAAWIHRTTGRKVFYVLPRCFRPFSQVQSLLELQSFSAGVALVGHPVRAYGCGGQPYRFNPHDYGLAGEYANLGCRWWPKKFITEYQAEEHGFGWDPDWVLELGDYAPSDEYEVVTEQLSPVEGRIDLSKDVLFNARRLAAAKHRACFFSGMAAVLYFARVPFTLVREPWQPTCACYFPDSTRYDLAQLYYGDPPPEIAYDRRLTQWLVLKGQIQRIYERVRHKNQNPLHR